MELQQLKFLNETGISKENIKRIISKTPEIIELYIEIIKNDTSNLLLEDQEILKILLKKDLKKNNLQIIAKILSYHINTDSITRYSSIEAIIKSIPNCNGQNNYCSILNYLNESGIISIFLDSSFSWICKYFEAIGKISEDACKTELDLCKNICKFESDETTLKKVEEYAYRIGVYIQYKAKALVALNKRDESYTDEIARVIQFIAYNPMGKETPFWHHFFAYFRSAYAHQEVFKNTYGKKDVVEKIAESGLLINLVIQTSQFVGKKEMRLFENTNFCLLSLDTQTKITNLSQNIFDDKKIEDLLKEIDFIMVVFGSIGVSRHIIESFIMDYINSISEYMTIGYLMQKNISTNIIEKVLEEHNITTFDGSTNIRLLIENNK